MAEIRRRRKTVTINLQPRYAPCEIARYVAEYDAKFEKKDRKMEEAGQRILAGDYSRANLERICLDWKSPRVKKQLRRNTDAEIAIALKGAVNARDINEAINSLTSLYGVAVRMANMPR